MNEAIECLKLYMNNRKIGNNVSQEYIDMVNLLIESCVTVQGENTQLKQQLKETNNCLNLQISNVTLLEKELKDKDEKISKVIEYIKENEYFDFDYNSYQLNNYKNIKYILESNKEE